jgi:putative glutamine amidotransferase
LGEPRAIHGVRARTPVGFVVMRTRRPLIGLPGRRKQIGQITGFPESLHHLHVDIYFADYARSVLRAGGLPVHLPIDADPADWAHHLDGLVLTGGADVEPERYGHDNTDSTTEPRRDEVEFTLFEAALADGLPVLGICRGLQLINVHQGGTLRQHVPEHSRYDIKPHEEAHTLTITPGTTLHALYGATATVNSLHHQTVGEVGAGLTVVAVDESGTVEGLEMTDAPVIAVQWHPEMMTHDDPAFDWLVERARRC